MVALEGEPTPVVSFTPDLGRDPLGATSSLFGNASSYGQRDKYVSRAKDESLTAALCAGRLVVLVGPSKAGKTRTAFEVLRAHADWGRAALPIPKPQSLAALAGHPALHTPDPVVIWLDDPPRFLPPAGDLSQATISRLLERPGPTVLLATLRSEQRQLLRATEDELTRDVRMVLDNATSIELRSTREDSGEQDRAAAVYPEIGHQEGLDDQFQGQWS